MIAEVFMPSFDGLRARIERVLELVQVDRPGVAARVLDELLAIEKEGRRGDLELFADAAGAAAGLARRWHRGALPAADARVGVFRLTLAMLRELAAKEAP